MTDCSVCFVVPTYDNPDTIGGVVATLRRHLDCVIVVDDGGGSRARTVLDELAAAGSIELVRFDQNRGKGAAVSEGLRRAKELGFTHAFQVDADGQHDLDAIPAFLEATRADPERLILGYPRFDQTVPVHRRFGRLISVLWVAIEVGSRVIVDSLCGFRVYPINRALASGTRCARMEYDTEVAVRMVWSGVKVTNLPVGVRYLTHAEGGVSHFRLIRDNLAISRLHTRLVVTLVGRILARWLVTAAPRLPQAPR